MIHRQHRRIGVHISMPMHRLSSDMNQRFPYMPCGSQQAAAGFTSFVTETQKDISSN